MVAKHFIVFFLATFLSASASVNVTVDKVNINEGESITLSLNMKNIDDDPDIILPDIPNFRIVNGPNTSSSTNIQFLNGEMTRSATIIMTWSLIPIKMGRLIIPNMTFDIGNRTYETEPISIIVNKRGNNTRSKIAKYFIEAEVDNKTPYRGEQVTLTYTLYTQVDITSFNEDLPKYKGFWTEEIYSPTNLTLRKVQKNNIQYSAATIKKIALFPTKSGKVQIHPMTAVIGVRENKRRNNFSLFGPPSTKHTISTNIIDLDVQSLPMNAIGESSAVVGDWNIQSNISEINIKQDEAITLKVVVSGIGNIQAVDITNISFPNELEVFTPEITIEEHPFRDKIGGKKHFEWVLIPRFAGNIYIPKINFTYFDSKVDKWITKSTNRYQLNIRPNEKAKELNLGLSKKEIALVGKDIRFLDDRSPKWRNRNRVLLTGNAITFLVFAGFILALPRAHGYARKKMNYSTSNRKSRKALHFALIVLNANNKSPNLIYTNIYKALITFINYKTGSKKVEYSRNELISILKNQNLEQIYPKVDRLLKKGEAVRFASIRSKDANEDLQLMRALLKEINNAWV